MGGIGPSGDGRVSFLYCLQERLPVTIPLAPKGLCLERAHKERVGSHISSTQEAESCLLRVRDLLNVLCCPNPKKAQQHCHSTSHLARHLSPQRPPFILGLPQLHLLQHPPLCLSFPQPGTPPACLLSVQLNTQAQESPTWVFLPQSLVPSSPYAVC